MYQCIVSDYSEMTYFNVSKTINTRLESNSSLSLRSDLGPVVHSTDTQVGINIDKETHPKDCVQLFLSANLNDTLACNT